MLSESISSISISQSFYRVTEKDDEDSQTSHKWYKQKIEPSQTVSRIVRQTTSQTVSQPDGQTVSQTVSMSNRDTVSKLQFCK